MSNPVKELFKGQNPSKIEAPDWVAHSGDAIESAYDKAGDELSSAIDRGIHFYKTVQKRVGKEANEVDAILHHNPYPTILIGMLASSVIGYLVACRINRGSSMGG
jgi:ElaB/YqjD/DUF883 family membrane-anchored ribosome-binding protein